MCRCAWALNIACYSAVFSFSALYSGRASDVPLHADLVYRRAPKAASLESCEIYALARRGRVMGLQCMTLYILKQVLSASYMVSGICHMPLLVSSGLLMGFVYFGFYGLCPGGVYCCMSMC